MKIYLLLIPFSFLLACSPKELPTITQLSEEKTVLKLSHQSTKSEMEDFAQRAKELGFSIDFSASEFFDNGKLRRLSLSVATPIGQSGRTTADGVTLQFQYYGFVWEKNGNFLIGNVDK